MKADKPRIPPGQVVTTKFPVLHVGPIPPFDPQRWDFRIFGLLEEEVVFSYQEFMTLPKVEIVSDFHCVTRWSRLGNVWEGVSFQEVMKHIKPRPEARHVMVHSDGGYTTNLPLLPQGSCKESLLDDDVLFAYGHDSQDLTPEHGWPLRLVVPKRYAWKSAKWVRGLEFMEDDRPGYWEARGYHNDGDPWKEERYANQPS